jgi:nicotinamide-nucleotide amidase
MRAIILAVGTELLGTDRLDTNSLKLTEVLRAHGVQLLRKAALPDLEDVVAAELGRAFQEVELVLVSGGLGPTADDITREALAAAAGVALALDESLLAGIERRFARMGLRMPETNRKQAEVLAGATVLTNRRGSAPGQRLDVDRTTVFLFPGVPTELEGMIESALEPWLEERAPAGDRIETVTLRVACLPESEVEARILPAYAEFGREDITVLAALGDVRVRATAGGAGETREVRLRTMQARLAELLGDAVYASGGQDAETTSLEATVGRSLLEKGRTVAVAESCTGGLISERLTRVAGSSGYVLGGVVAYANAAKSDLLGVDPAWIAEHGAVSEPVARALAIGACRVFGADWGIGVTGVAGPGGGSVEKPVGTVFLSVAASGDAVATLRLRLPGDRERVRLGASQFALEMLRRALHGLPAIEARSWVAAPAVTGSSTRA